MNRFAMFNLPVQFDAMSVATTALAGQEDALLRSRVDGICKAHDDTMQLMTQSCHEFRQASIHFCCQSMLRLKFAFAETDN